MVQTSSVQMATTKEGGKSLKKPSTRAIQIPIVYTLWSSILLLLNRLMVQLFQYLHSPHIFRNPHIPCDGSKGDLWKLQWPLSAGSPRLIAHGEQEDGATARTHPLPKCGGWWHQAPPPPGHPGAGWQQGPPTEVCYMCNGILKCTVAY